MTTPVELLADELLDVHHHIESAVGLDAADALDAVHPLHHVVTAALESLAHDLHTLLGGSEGGHSGLLGDGAGGAGAVAEVVGDSPWETWSLAANIAECASRVMA